AAGDSRLLISAVAEASLFSASVIRGPSPVVQRHGVARAELQFVPQAAVIVCSCSFRYAQPPGDFRVVVAIRQELPYLAFTWEEAARFQKGTGIDLLTCRDLLELRAQVCKADTGYEARGSTVRQVSQVRHGRTVGQDDDPAGQFGKDFEGTSPGEVRQQRQGRLE